MADNQSPIHMFGGDDPAMLAAYSRARETFKYFWRELSWEYRRIVPAFDSAVIKLPFTDGPRDDDAPEYEHMWVTDVTFDGDTVKGVLMNGPRWITSVVEGDQVQAPLDHVEDWMITCDGKAYGAFTVHVVRTGMNKKERQQHDAAWDLDFGDPNSARILNAQASTAPRSKPQKKGFLSRFMGGGKGEGEAGGNAGEQAEDADHQMCLNMLEEIEKQLQQDPAHAKAEDEATGWTTLHTEALAGNLGIVKLLVQYGADPFAMTHKGKNAKMLARKIGWTHVVDYLVELEDAD